MFIWTDESIEWYQEALRVTGHHKKMFEEVAEFFSPDEDVFDIGCGMGFLDMEIAGIVHHITGVDIEERVIRILEEEAMNRNIGNLNGMVSDWKELGQECCDTLMLCSFGTLEQDLADLMGLCRKRLIMLKRNGLQDEKCFEVEHMRLNGSNQDEMFLKERGIPFQMKIFYSDFGQPLKDKAQAERFISHYGLLGPDEDLEGFFRGYMIRTGDKEYPYYLPNPKNVHVIIIEKDEFAKCIS